RTIVIPPSSSIPTFSGNTLESPRQFLIRVKEYAETINYWNDQLLLNGIAQFLRGTALEWYCQLRVSNRRPQTWIEFKVIFLNQFNSPIRRARQEQQWKDCKQEEDETINEFIVRLRALCQEQKPNETENDLIRHLMCKMRNNLLTMIGISRCESLDEIITEAQKIEEILYQRNKQQHRNDNHDLFHNDISTTTMYNNDDHHELPRYYRQKAELPPPNLCLQLADRSQLYVKYTLSLPITISNSTRVHRIYVVPKLWRSCIIGNDLIRKHNLQIDGGR
ncbi:unnamed protein product, partial [Rotaria magnacalcarata]